MWCIQKGKQGLFVFVLSLLPLISFAGIAEFNKAMQEGDYKTAAKEANTVWETFDKDGKQTAVVAREFGFVNYLASDYANAERLATFLVEKGQGLSVPDGQPATSKLLLRLAQFGKKRSKNTRKALEDAVNARIAAEGVDQISLMAAETLYRYDWVSGDWENAKMTAIAAGKLYARAGGGYVKGLRETEIIAAASDFLHNPAHSDYDLIVTAHNQIVNDINQSQNEQIQNTLLPLKWQAQAWASTMAAYFHSTYSQAGSIINTRLKPQELTAITAAVKPADTIESSLPVCAGRVDIGNLVYPQRWAEQRLTGSVVIQLDFGADGNVSNSKILAEAPPGLFTDTVKESASTFQWKVNPGVDTSTCRIKQNNYIEVIGFWQNCADVYNTGDCRGTTTEAPPQPSDTSGF